MNFREKSTGQKKQSKNEWKWHKIPVMEGPPCVSSPGGRYFDREDAHRGRVGFFEVLLQVDIPSPLKSSW